ncbi:hypothetical protein [Rathayibacter iranicus]|uniref:hypothetical protein n=1 Tax=Rathayibacter iranicus TaxID=59737 RepID=UPI001CA47763|nr:hypothetical protein [Rathayibacter iranicus]
MPEFVMSSAALVLGIVAMSPSAMAAELSSPRAPSTSVQAVPQLDQATSDAVVDSLADSPLPRETHTEGGKTVTSYNLGGGITITTVVPVFSTTSPVGAVSFLSGGWDVTGPYLDLNRVDQGVVASGGAGGLAVGLCAIPGVGVPLCASATAVLAAAAAYIASNGLCGDEMRIHLQQLGYPECVSS